MQNQMSSNMEDYLETIHLLEQEHGNVRVKDIACALNVTMPSVSGAVKKMKKMGLVRHSRYDLIALTPNGINLAENIYLRHQTIKKFLQHILGLDPEIAEHDACRIEHNISPETLEGFSRFLNEGRG